jgi:hypothetical protein
MKQLLANGKTMKKTAIEGLYLLLFSFCHVAPCNSQESAHVATPIRTPGKATAYKFSFINEVAVTEKTEIQITFPQGYDLSGLIMATMSPEDGGLATEVNGNVVRIKQLKAMQLIPSGTNCELYLASVINPINFEDLQDFVLNFFENGKSVWRKDIQVTIEQLTANTK